MQAAVPCTGGRRAEARGRMRRSSRRGSKQRLSVWDETQTGATWNGDGNRTQRRDTLCYKRALGMS